TSDQVSAPFKARCVRWAKEKKPLWKKFLYPFRPYVANGYSLNLESQLAAEFTPGATLWVSRLAHGQYIKFAKKLGYRVVLDEHNVESDLVHSLGAGLNPLSRWASVSLRHYEKKFCLSSDLVVVTSQEDEKKIQSLTRQKALVIPNLIDADKYLQLKPEIAAKEILFAGTLDYEPNRRGLHWFIEQLYPALSTSLHEAGWRIRIVGARPGNELRESMNKPGIELNADVPSVLPYLEQASIIMVPLLNGGGTRLKIVEAMAAGKAIISTSLGAEGITGIEHGKNIYLADTASEFIAGIEKLVRDPAFAAKLGANARSLAEGSYDWRCGRAQILRLENFSASS
ncbi:MAG: glycosyltransferase, partial [Bdellovibrionota bacterium]